MFKNSKKLETGISDHRYLVLTSLRSQYIQGSLKIKFYRDYKYFNFESFNYELNELLKSEKGISYFLFENFFLQVLNVHSPVKKIIERFNNNPFMTKQRRKAWTVLDLKIYLTNVTHPELRIAIRNCAISV